MARSRKQSSHRKRRSAVVVIPVRKSSGHGGSSHMQMVAGVLAVLIIAVVVVAFFRGQINTALRGGEADPAAPAPFQIPELPQMPGTGSVTATPTPPTPTPPVPGWAAIPAMALFLLGVRVGHDLIVKHKDGIYDVDGEKMGHVSYFGMMVALVVVTWLIVSVVSWWLSGTTDVFWVMFVAVMVGLVIGVVYTKLFYKSNADYAKEIAADGEVSAYKREIDALRDNLPEERVSAIRQEVGKLVAPELEHRFAFAKLTPEEDSALHDIMDSLDINPDTIAMNAIYLKKAREFADGLTVYVEPKYAKKAREEWEKEVQEYTTRYRLDYATFMDKITSSPPFDDAR